MAATAKVFMSGRSQAVRLPKEFRFDVDEVTIERTNEGILLRTKTRLELFREFMARPKLDDDFVIPREQGEFERDDAYWVAMFGEDATSSKASNEKSSTQKSKSKAKTAVSAKAAKRSTTAVKKKR